MGSSGTPRRLGPSAPWGLGFQCLSPREWTQPSSVGLVSSPPRRRRVPWSSYGPAFLLSWGGPSTQHPALPPTALEGLCSFLSTTAFGPLQKENSLFHSLVAFVLGPVGPPFPLRIGPPRSKSHKEFRSSDSSVFTLTQTSSLCFPLLISFLGSCLGEPHSLALKLR